MRRFTARFRSLLRGVARRSDLESEMEEEFRFHVERRTEDLVHAGVPPAEAARRARLEFGSADRYREEGVEARGLRLLDELRRNARHALRLLRRSPGFTAVAVLTLGLGIGANGAIFSLVSALLLRPLPYPDADRLVWIASSAVTEENLPAWRAGMRSFEQVGAFGLRSPVWTGHGPAERLGGMIASAELLPLLGGAPEFGRLWTEGEHRPGAPRTVVVTHTLWDRLGADGVRVGEATLTLDGESWTIIGVLPAAFQDLHYDSDLFFAAGAVEARGYNLIGRLRPGATVALARAEAAALAERVDLAGDASARRSANVNAITEVYRGDVRAPLLVLFAAAGFVLLIACANVANLLLSRAAVREREIVVRSALGAGRGALLRQLLTECGLLALAGALVGVLIASVTLRGILLVVPAFFGLNETTAVRVDVTVLAFALLLAFATTLLAGITPALHATRRLSRGAAGLPRAGGTRGARRVRGGLVAVEFALALVLLVGTVLLSRTFLELRPASPGFEARDRIVARMNMPENHDEVVRVAFARRLLAEIEGAAPGTRAAVATNVPLNGWGYRLELESIDGRAVEGQADVELVSASPDYFDVIGMRPTRGRGLRATDLPGTAPVAVVNESAVRRLWDGDDPIGRRFAVAIDGQRREFTVVGVVADARSSGYHTRSPATAFLSFWQAPMRGIELLIHAPPGTGVSMETIRGAVANVAPDLPIDRIRRLDSLLADAVAEPRYQMVLMGAFAALAVGLALIGCYGVLSYTVAQRTREIGVRVALGAHRGVIVRSVMANAAALVAIGLVAGTLIALAATRVLESSLYGVTSPRDPVTLIGSAAVLALVGMAAAFVPARRAASVQPIEALRMD